MKDKNIEIPDEISYVLSQYPDVKPYPSIEPESDPFFMDIGGKGKGKRRKRKSSTSKRKRMSTRKKTSKHSRHHRR